LAISRSSNISLIIQVEKKGADLGRFHIGGMAQAMKADVPSCPIDIGALGAEGVVLIPDASA
jgi:hypothetical protein